MPAHWRLGFIIQALDTFSLWQGPGGTILLLPDLSLPTWGAFLCKFPKSVTSKETRPAPLLTPTVSGLGAISTHFSWKKFETSYLELAQMCEDQNRKYKPFSIVEKTDFRTWNSLEKVLLKKWDDKNLCTETTLNGNKPDLMVVSVGRGAEL